jgi:hypothetical protein
VEKQYMGEQLRRAGAPAPKVIGIDEISIRRGHTYRIVVSDLLRRRPIWFGGQDRSEASLELFYQQLGTKKSQAIYLAVMDMWKPFKNATVKHAPDAAILFDKFHVLSHLGEALDYAVTWKGQWFAVATWSAAALHLKARDQFIGWTEEQRRQRLPLVVNNSRLYVLAQCHYPNLVSRFMKLMLARLSSDWENTWGHPVALAESFVDPQQYRGTAYKVSGWSQLGLTRGWKRSAVDFYEKHDHPKQVWVRELVKKACVKLRAAQLPPPWAEVLPKVPPRCTAKAGEIASLMERLGRDIPEFRRKQSLV